MRGTIARVVALEVPTVCCGRGVRFRLAHTDRRSSRETAAARRRPGSRVEVHLLAEAVGVQQERPRPASGQWRQRCARRTRARSRRPAARRRTCRRPPQEQAARRPRACSGRASLPRRRRQDARVVVANGSRPSGVVSAEKPRHREVARRGIETRDARTAPAVRDVDEDLVPVDRACVVTMRTSRTPTPGAASRSTTTVCGRPTGMPIPRSTVRHAPVAVLDLERRRAEAAGRAWCAATLSLENA